MIIAWYSQSHITPRQQEELRRIYGEHIQIRKFREPKSAEEFARHFRQTAAEECVVVSSELVLMHILQQGISPVYPVMEECDKTHPEYEIGPIREKYFRFLKFRRLIKLNFINAETALPHNVEGDEAVILRVTANDLLTKENEAINVIYNGKRCRIPSRRIDFNNPCWLDELNRYIQELKVNDLVLVAPIPIWEKICQQGIYPLRAILGDGKRFERFDRVMGVEREFEDI